MIKKFFLLFIPICLFAIPTPYESLELDEKIDLMANYFFNEELKTKLPKKPKKQEHEKLGNIPPIKYEQYFSYIQRLKGLKRAWDEEEKKINEKYEGEVGYYNGNMKTLFKHYKMKENQDELIQNSINKTLKVFFGKPKIQNLKQIKDLNIISADIFSNDFYGYGYIFKRKVDIEVPKEQQMALIERYRRALVIINVHYESQQLEFLDAIVSFEGKKYKVKFKDFLDQKIKLDIKINDDIFRPIKLREE